MGYKLLALFLAVLFWFIIQSEQKTQVKRPIRIKFKAPHSFIVREGPFQYLDAIIQGPKSLINNYPVNKALDATIPLHANAPGKISVMMNKDYLNSWDNRLRLRLNDPYVTVYLDKKAEKSLPIKESLIGRPEEGYFIEKTIISPSSVLVVGPANDLATISSLVSKPVDISRLKKTKVFNTKIVVTTPALRITKRNISIKVIIGERKVERTFEKIPVEMITSSKKRAFEVDPKFINVTLLGTKNEITKTLKSEIRAKVEIKHSKVGRFEEKINLKYPSNLILIKASSHHIKIKIKNRAGNL